MKFINIKEVLEDKNSLFNIKIFKYKNLTFDFIVKTIDLKNVKVNKWNEIVKNWEGPIVLENTKEINSPKNIDNILQKDYSRQNKFFKVVSSLSGYPCNIIITFNFNSLKEIQELIKNESCEAFFDLYCGYSNFWLFVPNIKPKKYIQVSENKRKLVNIVDVRNYINFVESIFEILDYKNSKPIFVPVSLKFDIKNIREIISYYLKKEYFYIWIDFEGSAINERAVGILRNIYRTIENFGRMNDVLLYFTNIKREIISHVKDEKTPASDVLSSLVGGNIIGINREPRRVVNENAYSKEELKLHKARILDRESYYYVKLISEKVKINDKDELLKDQKYIITLNNLLLHKEIKLQCDKFLQDNNIKDYISTKTMLREHPKGISLYQKIFKIKKSDRIITWF